MAFVPGFDHDLFISYAHGDDRDWINRFLDRLRPALARRLPGADVWIDRDDLRRSRNFRQDIPANLHSSAVLFALVSPTFIGRPYCVHDECGSFADLANARKAPGQRFSASEFAADLFAFRCPILPLDGTQYRDYIFPGATDICFCDDIDVLPIGSPAFEEQFRLLLRDLISLLRRMRNSSTPVLVYPYQPAPDVADVHAALTRELTARSYRIVPEDELDPAPHAARCELAVLLLGASYSENARRLVSALIERQKSFLVWPSPSLESTGTLEQRGFFQYLLQLEFGKRSLLSSVIPSEKVKQEVLQLLNPAAKLPAAAGQKPRVYLIYDSRRNNERNNAGKIAFHYKDEFHFDHSDNPRQHSLSLTQSDGVLLVWGEAGEDWCAREFEQMVRLSSQPLAKGICLFDPVESKVSLADQIRRYEPSIHVASWRSVKSLGHSGSEGNSKALWQIDCQSDNYETKSVRR